MQIIESFNTTNWAATFSSDQQQQAITALETGKIILLPQLAFKLAPMEERFLSPQYVDSKAKNISYDLRGHTLRGVQGSRNDKEQLQTMMKRFAIQARQLIDHLFPLYQTAIVQARTSFRPVEISYRKTSYRKDDKRLHVDAFPATPNQGKRILRVFSNVNPRGEDRVWRVGESFETVAQRFLPSIRKPLAGSAKLLHLLKITKSRRTYYDHIMLQIHDRMKADEVYQQQAEQCEIRFAPRSSWIVQTDQVSHAAMSGQHVLEQTFYLPAAAMQDPQRSPLRILEKLMGELLAL